MSASDERRVVRWWLLAERVCARVAVPKTHVADADRDFDTLVRGSWLWSQGESLVSRIGAAWLDSKCRRLVQSIASLW